MNETKAPFTYRSLCLCFDAKVSIEAILSLQAYSGMPFIKRWIEILCAFGYKAKFMKNYALKVRAFVLQLLV